MMKRYSIRKLLCLIGCIMLAAALALSFTGCGEQEEPAKEGVSFQVVVTDLVGKETTFDYVSDQEMVGQFLYDEGLIDGEFAEYGLYIKTVNGITLDWDKDQKYWAFYINGEYAQTGADSTPIEEGTIYGFKPEG